MKERKEGRERKVKRKKERKRNRKTERQRGGESNVTISLKLGYDFSIKRPVGSS